VTPLSEAQTENTAQEPAPTPLSLLLNQAEVHAQSEQTDTDRAAANPSEVSLGEEDLGEEVGLLAFADEEPADSESGRVVILGSGLDDTSDEDMSDDDTSDEDMSNDDTSDDDITTAAVETAAPSARTADTATESNGVLYLGVALTVFSALGLAALKFNSYFTG